MRLRRPAVAATTLGLAGALLTASGAAAGVTPRWTNQEFWRSQTYTYTGEGDVEITVSGHATPYNFYGDGVGADGVSSLHTAEFADCVSDCEWSRTLTFSSK